MQTKPTLQCTGILMDQPDVWLDFGHIRFRNSDPPDGKVDSVKGPDIYILRLQGNQNSSGLQCEVSYWPALAVGSAARLAAAHCPNEWTLDPQSAARQTSTGLHPQCSHCDWQSAHDELEYLQAGILWMLHHFVQKSLGFGNKFMRIVTVLVWAALRWL